MKFSKLYSTLLVVEIILLSSFLTNIQTTTSGPEHILVTEGRTSDATGEQAFDSLSNPSVLRDCYLSYSKGAAEWLMSIAIPEAGGYTWGHSWRSSIGMTAGSASWIEETAGIGNYFLEVFSRTGNQTFLDYAKGAAQWLISNASAGKGGYYWTLYESRWGNFTGRNFGAAGIGEFFLNAFKATGNQTFLDYAMGAAQWLDAVKMDSDGNYSWSRYDQAPANENYTGLAYGAAGIGDFFLALHACTGNDTYLDLANGAAAWLISVAQPAGGGYRWFVSSSYMSYNTGFDSGAAGIGSFFLHIFHRTGNQTYLQYAEGAGTWLDTYKFAESGGYYWRLSDTSLDRFTGYDSGAAGIGTFFLSLFHATGNETYLNLANGAARWLASTANILGNSYNWVLKTYPANNQYYTGQYSGTAGIGSFLLKIYEVTGNATFLEYVRGAARWLISTANASDAGYRWTELYQPQPSIWFNTGLFGGAAGIGEFFLACAQAPWDPAPLNYSRAAAEYVLQMAQSRDGGLVWNDSTENFYHNTGLERGCAGIGEVFLTLFQRTANLTYLECAKNVSQFLIANATPALGGYKWKMALEPSIVENYTGIGDGVAGVGHFFLEAFKATGNTTYLDYANGAGQWLNAIKTDVGGNYSWPSEEGGSYFEASYKTGAAGIAEFYLELFQTTGNQTYFDIASGAGRWIISQAQTAFGGNYWLHKDFPYNKNLTGYNEGVSGIGASLFRLYTATGNTTFYDCAVAAFQWVINVAEGQLGGYTWREYFPDSSVYYTSLNSGTAGIALCLLDAYSYTANQTYLNYACGATQWLINVATEQRGRAAWQYYPGANVYYEGIGPGTAGIAALHLELYGRTGNQTFLTYARKAAHWLLDRATPRNGGLAWNRSVGETSLYNDYWYGTAGITWFFSHAVELDFQPPSILSAGFSNSNAFEPFFVNAEVIDNYAVDTVIYSWTIDNGVSWHNITTNQIAPTFWEGQIPGQAGGTTIIFKIYANDSLNNWQFIDWTTLQYLIPGSPPNNPTDWMFWVLIIAIIAIILAIALIAVRTRRQPATEFGKGRYVSKATRAATKGATVGRQLGELEKTAVAPSAAPEIAIIPLVTEEEHKETAPGVYAYRGGRIVGPKFVYKVKVKNATDTSITDIIINLVSYPRDCMKLTTEETRRVAKIEPGGFRSLEFELQPMKDCVEGSLVSSVVYLDAKNEPHPLTVAPFTLRSVCDLMEPLEISEADFDVLVTKWAKTGETISFKGEDVRALAADVPAIFESKNFHPVVQHVKENAGVIIAEAKGIAIGKYTKRRLALVVQVRGTAGGSRGDGEITCMGYAEESSMLAACLSEVLDEFRKPLIRLLRKLLKENKNAMDVTQLQAALKVDAHVLADAVRQQDDLVFLRGGETVASYDFLADFINNMRKDYNTIPVGELEADLRPVGKSMRTIIQDLLISGQVRAVWVGADEIQFKLERHKVAFKMLYYAIAVGSGVVTILVFLWNFFK